MTERNIASPDGVDSLERLDGWLISCGMPQVDAPEFSGWAKLTPERPTTVYEINHEKLSFATVKELAAALYSRFVNPRYAYALWRHKPKFVEAGDRVECRLGLLIAEAA